MFRENTKIYLVGECQKRELLPIFNRMQAQVGLRAANERFNEEVVRMNTELANAEDALEKRVKQCQ